MASSGAGVGAQDFACVLCTSFTAGEWNELRQHLIEKHTVDAAYLEDGQLPHSVPPYTNLHNIEEGVACYLCAAYSAKSWTLLYNHCRHKHQIDTCILKDTHLHIEHRKLEKGAEKERRKSRGVIKEEKVEVEDAQPPPVTAPMSVAAHSIIAGRDSSASHPAPELPSGTVCFAHGSLWKQMQVKM